MDDLVTAFNALPEAPFDLVKTHTVWTVHLQRSMAFFVNGDAEDLEITIYREGMIEPAIFACQSSKMTDSPYSCYVACLILEAFTVEANRQVLLKLQCDNQVPRVPRRVGEEIEAYAMRCSLDPKMYVPAGRLPNALYKLYKPRQYSVGEKATGAIYRPRHFFIRDVHLQQLFSRPALLLDLDIMVIPHSDLATSFAAEDGRTPRRDVTFCAYIECGALSTGHSRCARCGLAHYCSKEHQAKDWPVHKVSCSNLATQVKIFEPLRRRQLEEHSS